MKEWDYCCHGGPWKTVRLPIQPNQHEQHWTLRKAKMSWVICMWDIIIPHSIQNVITCQELPGPPFPHTILEAICWGWLGQGTRLGMHQDSFSLPPVSIIETIHVHTLWTKVQLISREGQLFTGHHAAHLLGPSFAAWEYEDVRKSIAFLSREISSQGWPYQHAERLLDTRSDTLLVLY